MTTTTLPATQHHADRYHRAPKGGAISPVNGLWYAGGQFMPLATADKIYHLARPMPLAGSVRQIPWANRLRREALGRIEDEIHVRRLFLASPTKSTDLAAQRTKVRELMVAQYHLMMERSAAAIIERQHATA